ncbi:hypothetical protein GCM10007876_37550 [Litoribrevibacter albus]|uniref:Alpha/beta hydrolase n=2 Tax=Litoribrevibacter albus TaxID=1473156 RepID=A0AA37SDZ7_9GAMM|nr:hypothetical protein GCM10007876_37550 [Litoribrevibacter albus]
MDALALHLSKTFDCPGEVIALPGYELTDTLAGEDAYAHWHEHVEVKLSSYKRPLLLGWSYGGMLAVRLGDELVSTKSIDLKVVVFGTRPMFLDDPWTVFDHQVAKSFRARVAASPHKGLAYFVALNSQEMDKSLVVSLKQDMQASKVEKEVLLESLDHLYELDVSKSWSSLMENQRLMALYFKADALVRVPDEIELIYQLKGGHLSPVFNSSELSDRIERLLIG